MDMVDTEAMGMGMEVTVVDMEVTGEATITIIIKSKAFQVQSWRVFTQCLFVLSSLNLKLLGKDYMTITSKYYEV